MHHVSKIYFVIKFYMFWAGYVTTRKWSHNLHETYYYYYY
jgi:hypothetical protein